MDIPWEDMVLVCRAINNEPGMELWGSRRNEDPLSLKTHQHVTLQHIQELKEQEKPIDIERFKSQLQSE